MFAFSNLFYIQLGSVMPDFSDQLASFLSLARVRRPGGWNPSD